MRSSILDGARGPGQEPTAGRRTRLVRVAGGLAAAVLVVAGCGSNGDQEQASPSLEADTEPETADAEDADDAPETGPEELNAYHDELHDIAMPPPGTAELTVEGVSYIVEDIDCTLDDNQVSFNDSGVTPDGDEFELHTWRGSLNVENEGVQLSILDGEVYNIANFQAERGPGGTHRFLQGAGDIYPAVRAVDNQITAVGTFRGAEVAGDFTLAADCG